MKYSLLCKLTQFPKQHMNGQINKDNKKKPKIMYVVK